MELYWKKSVSEGLLTNKQNLPHNIPPLFSASPLISLLLVLVVYLTQIQPQQFLCKSELE